MALVLGILPSSLRGCAVDGTGPKQVGVVWCRIGGSNWLGFVDQIDQAIVNHILQISRLLG